MDDESKQVVEKLENQTYFSEAMDWYSTRYTFVQTQFSQMLIVALMSIATIALTIIGFFSFLPVNEKIPFVVSHAITPEDHIRLESLMKKGEDPDHALIRYYTKEYVKSREEYIIERSERDFNFVSHLSGETVLQDYLNSISPDNPSSPFIVYANRGRRDIILDDLQYFDDKGNPTRHSTPKGKAIITFTAVENFGSEANKQADYIATMEFDYTKIIVDQKTHQLTRKAEMLITNYTTKINSGSTK